MELEVEIEQMLERLARDLMDSTLAHIRENGVKQFREEGCTYPRGHLR